MTAPTIGRIVHYTSYGTPNGEYDSACRAAIVTEVHSDTVVSLAVLNPTGAFFNLALPYDENQTGGTWHWPCVRTEEQ
jgi:hypothetical protein